jgi:hypothetical protein
MSDPVDSLVVNNKRAKDDCKRVMGRKMREDLSLPIALFKAKPRS